jgi:hypothetical protein
MASNKRWETNKPGFSSKLLQKPPILIDAVGKGWRAKGYEQREAQMVSLAEARARWASTQPRPEKVVPGEDLRPREAKVRVIDGQEYEVVWDGA